MVCCMSTFFALEFGRAEDDPKMAAGPGPDKASPDKTHRTAASRLPRRQIGDERCVPAIRHETQEVGGGDGRRPVVAQRMIIQQRYVHHPRSSTGETCRSGSLISANEIGRAHV